MNFLKLLIINISPRRSLTHKRNTKVKNDSFWIQASLAAARREGSEKAPKAVTAAR